MIYYTDGSAHPNPGPGGFGCVILSNDNKIIGTYSKQTSDNTTNNREEMKAILFAVLHSFQQGDKNPIIYSDSSYSINTFSNWMYSWYRNGWLKSDKKTPENLDIIKEYKNLIEKNHIKVTFNKVKGHAGLELNEMADKLARGEKL